MPSWHKDAAFEDEVASLAERIHLIWQDRKQRERDALAARVTTLTSSERYKSLFRKP